MFCVCNLREKCILDFFSVVMQEEPQTNSYEFIWLLSFVLMTNRKKWTNSFWTNPLKYDLRFVQQTNGRIREFDFFIFFFFGAPIVLNHYRVKCASNINCLGKALLNLFRGISSLWQTGKTSYSKNIPFSPKTRKEYRRRFPAYIFRIAW